MEKRAADARLRAFWARRGLANMALLPLAWLFGLGVMLRRGMYGMGLLKTHRLPVPVVVAGGITAGGGGKTTLVMALVRGLRDRGFSPGVVSRGHGGKATAATLVSADSDPALHGDEAVMVAASTGVPVAVGTDRPAAARLLLGACPEVDVLVADDGLQHLPLGRDFELAVVSSGYGLGNGWLLPAGPLREGKSRLASVDAVVQKGAVTIKGGHGLLLRDPTLTGADGARLDVAGLAGRRVAAVAGVAEPEGFFADLRAFGVESVTCLAFPDHHSYTADDLSSIDADVVVMTAKDEIKCRRFGDGRLMVFCQRAVVDPVLLDKIVARLGDEARIA